MTASEVLQTILIIPVLAGSVFCLLSGWAATLFFSGKQPPSAHLLPVTVLKPIYGLDKGFEENLLSLCSFRKGGGLVDAPGRRSVGAKGEYPTASR